jgi:hypothetical protein
VATKAGFRQEGILREHDRCHTGRSDMVLFSREGFNYPDSGPPTPVACGLLQAKGLHAVLTPVLPGLPSPRSLRSPPR